MPVSPQGWNAARPAAAAVGGSFYCLGLLNYTPKDSSVRPHEANAATPSACDLRYTGWSGLGATGFARRAQLGEWEGKRSVLWGGEAEGWGTRARFWPMRPKSFAVGAFD